MQERQLKEYDNNLNRQMDLTSIIERWKRKNHSCDNLLL